MYDVGKPVFLYLKVKNANCNKNRFLNIYNCLEKEVSRHRSWGGVFPPHSYKSDLCSKLYTIMLDEFGGVFYELRQKD